MTIPGVRETAAASIIAEIGVDMSRFPSATHLVSGLGAAHARERRQALFDWAMQGIAMRVEVGEERVDDH